MDYDTLWERKLRLEREGISCFRLSPEDTLLYHCFHMGMHEFALGGLLSVWEFRKLILDDRPDLRTCSRRARQWGTLRITWCAFRLLETCFPGTLSGKDRLFAPSPLLKMLLEKLVIAPSIVRLANPKRLSRPTQLLRKAVLVDRPTAAVSYLLWYLKSRHWTHPSADG
ncbi:MAG: nucleotidyltransferase family protein [Planctomycetota bacterium]